MNVAILREYLQEKVSLVNHGVSSRNQLPVLLNIFVEARKGEIILKSTDLEIGIEVRAPANTEEEGTVTVPGKLFQELVSTLSDEKIKLRTKNNSLEVDTKNIKSTLQTIDPEEFPNLYEDKGDKILEINQDSVLKNLTKVLFAASVDTNRPALSGIFVKQEGKECLIVATDGYRLSLKRIPVELKKEMNGKPLLIPARIFREIVSNKPNSNLSLYVSEKNNQVMFEQKDSLIIGRLIDAVFPSYEKIVPVNQTTRATFDREEMLKAVKVASLFARDSANVIKMRITKSGIELFAQAQSLGENRTIVEAKATGAEGEISFNARYLLDVLNHIEEEVVVFEMTGPLNPGVFKVENDPSFIHLIMPVRTQTD